MKSQNRVSNHSSIVLLQIERALATYMYNTCIYIWHSLRSCMIVIASGIFTKSSQT